jgi:mono/diheme cytochrome c family protein
MRRSVMIRANPVPTGLVAALMLVLASSLGSANEATGDATHAGDATKGRSIYLAVGCYECHGRQGQGGNFNYPAPILAQTKLPLEAFKALVRLGPNDMPAYTVGVLSDQDVADIHAFLQSLSGRRPAKDIPLLNQ